MDGYQNIPAVCVNSRLVFANTKTMGVRPSYMTCKPTLLGHIKYVREHPPALQDKTRGATDQWGFLLYIHKWRLRNNLHIQIGIIP